MKTFVSTRVVFTDDRIHSLVTALTGSRLRGCVREFLVLTTVDGNTLKICVFLTAYGRNIATKVGNCF